MSLWKVHVELSDDPASASFDVIVNANTKLGAKRLGVKAAKSAYYNEAGGWASNPVVSDEYPTEAEPYELPRKGVVAVTGGIHR